MLTVACVKQGGKYGAEYATALHRGVTAHLSLPHDFVCLTDEPVDGVPCRPLPEPLEGWWAKLGMFRPGAFPDGTRVLYFDLDTIICGGLDAIAAHDGPLAILRSFGVPHSYGSGVMAWEAGQECRIWDRWCAMGQRRLDYGDQAVINMTRPGAVIWQDAYPGKFVSYKLDCRDGVPAGAAVICFHGEPKPHQTDLAPLWSRAA